MTGIVIPIKVTWNENAQKWLLHFDDSFPQYAGMFFMDVWNCGTVRFALQNPDKAKSNHYILKIEKIEKG